MDMITLTTPEPDRPGKQTLEVTYIGKWPTLGRVEVRLGYNNGDVTFAEWTDETVPTTGAGLLAMMLARSPGVMTEEALLLDAVLARPDLGIVGTR